MSTNDPLNNEFVKKYKELGADAFYKLVLIEGLEVILKIHEDKYDGVYPDIQLLTQYNKFLSLYRKYNKDIYLDVAKIFRRAAHKLHRVMVRKKIITKNDKFLNSI